MAGIRTPLSIVARKCGISVVLSSHLMADVERTCDRILVIHSGRVARSGDVGKTNALPDVVKVVNGVRKSGRSNGGNVGFEVRD